MPYNWLDFIPSNADGRIVRKSTIDTNIPLPIEFDDFMKVDMRVGTVLTCEVNPKAKKPAYILTVDFGPLGIKTSSAQVTQNYTPEALVGKQVVAVVNFPVKRIAGIASEVLVLGAYSAAHDVVLLQPTLTVENGSRIG